MIVGIDPGVTGGIACIDARGKFWDVVPMPSLDGQVAPWEVVDVIESWDSEIPPTVAIEIQQSMPKQGVASTFKTGMNYGILLGIAAARDWPLHLVRPIDWKRTHGLVKKDKDASRKKASELWPAHRERWRLKKQDGLAEAALIAEHLRRVY